MNSLSNDLLQICISYLVPRISNDVDSDMEAFGNTCQANMKLITYFYADKYIDCIHNDVSIPQNVVRYLWKYVTSEEQREEIIIHMVSRLREKKIFLRVMGKPLPVFLRPYFSLIEPQDIDNLRSSCRFLESFSTTNKKMSIVVEYMETLMDCWVATNTTLISMFPSSPATATASTTTETIIQPTRNSTAELLNPGIDDTSTSARDEREMLIRSEMPAILTCLFDRFLLFEDIVQLPDISPVHLQLKDCSSRLYLLVTKKQISSADPIVMQMITLYTEYFTNLTVVLDCREEEDGRSVNELQDLPESFKRVVRHLSIYGKNIHRIGNNFLNDCRSLITLTLSKSITSIGNRFLYGCTGLTTVSIPESVTSIGNYFLYGCTGLTTVNIPDRFAKNSDIIKRG